MQFLDPVTFEGFEVIGWTPSVKPKRKALAPWEEAEFEAEAQQAAESTQNDKPEPTQAQKKSGRYAKGRVSFQGLKIAVENPRGSWRRGVDPGGKAWAVQMAHHYGYITRTVGADGEGVDVFIGPDLQSDQVFIVNQVIGGRFDEHKVMLGFPSEETARQGYLASFEPGWKGLGSIKACTMADFKAWLADGDLRSVAKAGFAEPGSDGTRWITVHPHGKDEPGHPVQIRPVAGHHGVFHIIGGADGKLNGLRLQGIKDPEDYRRESKQRAKERKAHMDAKHKAAMDKLTPEEKEERAARADDAKEKIKKAQEHLIRTTLQAQGINPDEAMELPGVDDKLAQHKHRQQLLSHAMRAAAEAQKRITLDADARTRAGLEMVGGDNQLTADEALSLTEDERGPGYQRNLREKAKEAGLTPQALEQAVEDLKLKGAEARVADGDYTERHEELGGGDPVKGILMAGAIMGEHNREAHLKAKLVKAASDGAIKESLKQAVTDNAQAAAILKARKELRLAMKEQRKGKATLFEGGYQVRIEDLDEAIIQDAEDALRTQRMNHFLDEVEEAHPDDDLDLGKPHVEEGMYASRGAGAFDALHEISLASMGQGAMDRETVEVLGPEGGAILMARALRSAYTPEEQAEVLKALEEVHLEEQEKELPQVMEEVNRLRTDAKAVQDELSETPRDLATAAEMQKNKVAMLKEARRLLGGTLGRMEARAALILALKEAPRETLSAPLGTLGRDQAILTAAALGLQDGDYSLDYEKGEGVLSLNAKGQQRLIRPYDQAAATERELAVAIKRGTFDEDGWLPSGFARRTDTRSNDTILDPPLFRKAFTPERATTAEELRQSVEDYIGARYADGDRATDILLALNTMENVEAVPEHLRGAYGNLLLGILPTQEAVLNSKGQQIIDRPKIMEVSRDEDGNIIRDEDGLPVEQHAKDETGNLRYGEAIPRFKPATAATVDKAAQAMAENHLKRTGTSDDKAFYAQRADIDSKEFAESLHQALAKDPRTAAAYIPTGELTTEQQRNIRDYFIDTFHGGDHGKAESSEAVGPEPEKMALDMFGEASVSPDWEEWSARKAAHGSNWSQFVTSMGGLKDAQKAVQAHMAGALLGHFADHYGRATGTDLKRGQTPIPATDQWLKSTGTPEEREQALAERQAETEALRRRDGDGRYSHGGVNDIRDEYRSRKAVLEAQSGGLGFDMEDLEDGPPVDKEAPAREQFRLRPGHRLSLGPALDGQFHQAMPNAIRAMQGQDRSVQLHPIAMSGRNIVNQRGVKAIQHLKRIGLFYGAGTGKTSVMVGAHAELAKTGKVKKAIYAVPSAVQAQFGAEAAIYLDPKSGLYIHAKPGETYEERLAAYRDPEAHGVVITHQTLRDDTLKVLANQVPVKSHEALVAWVHSASREELADAVKKAWTAAGVSPDALFLDEGHNALNRAGKQDSTLAKIVDAMGDNASYYAAATADPVKNDASEAYDWLTKIDPKRYPAKKRDEWMARYGKNTALMRRSMKAELARYYFTARVDPSDAAPPQEDGSKIGLSNNIAQAEVLPHQRQALDAVDKAMASLAFEKDPAKRAEAAKVLDPDSDLETVSKARGTFKEAAYNRILNCDPKGGKILKTVELAKQSVAAGKPAIVFARNLDAVEGIRAAMEEAGMRVATLTGKDSSAEKASKKDAFQGKNPTADVLVMSDAGACGLNIQRAQTVIHHDIPYTHMIHSQRTARAWRLGQMHNVTTHTVAADHAFDHTNLRRLKHKESLASIYKSAEGSLDDTGTAERLRAIRERRNQTHEPFAA